MLRSFAIWMTLVAASAGSVWAQTNIDLGGITVDNTAAVEITADSLSVDQETGSAVFVGNVIIGQGDLRLSAGQVEVIYLAETGNVARLIATEDVTFVTATEAAEAENAEYDITTGLLTMSGDVLLTQGPSAISAERMIINVTDGTATMEGRVRTVLQQGGN